MFYSVPNIKCICIIQYLSSKTVLLSLKKNAIDIWKLLYDILLTCMTSWHSLDPYVQDYTVSKPDI